VIHLALAAKGAAQAGAFGLKENNGSQGNGNDDLKDN
jgi:hypothetical protein